MISVVVPAYNEAAVLRALYERVRAAAEGWGEDWELVLVDDGSSDNTFALARKIADRDARVKVIALSRNFGHQAAVTAGLAHAAGELVAVMDADLQDPPEELARFFAKVREGYDVVYAIRTRRKENVLKRAAYSTYYRLLRRLASVEIPLDSGDFCVMTRRVVHVLNALPERSRFVRGLRSWAGYRQTGLEYERQARAGGDPKYTFGKLWKLGLDGVFSFSRRPLHLLMLTGIAVGTGAFFAGVFVFIQYATNWTIYGYNPRNATGWTSLMIVILFAAGVQLFGMGLLGEYIGRVFEETKNRPSYVVRETINLPAVRPGAAETKTDATARG